jgi:uncharacterized membrane protein
LGQQGRRQATRQPALGLTNVNGVAVGSFLESVGTFLFKYRPVVFTRGELGFAAAWPIVLALAVLVVALPVLLSYRQPGGRTSPTERVVLASLRAVALAVLAFCLARPVVTVSEAVAQRNVLGILVDDSRSMRIADQDGRPRADWVRTQLGGPDSALFKRLAEQFDLRVFGFSRGTQRVPSVAAMGFDGSRTSLGNALQRVEEELGGAPVAGLVVVSDGADNAPESLVEPLASLRARRVPVYTVGLGKEEIARDVAVSRVDLPRTALVGSTLLADVVVTQRGHAGARVALVAEDGGRIAASQPVTLGKDGEATPVRLRIPVSEAGARVMKFRIAPLNGETITANNERTVPVLVREAREKVLYIEGEPRFELKFLRAAVAADSQLQVVALLRTAENKFLRLGVDDSLELVTGFPTRREELFQYRAIILGSVEAAFFTLDQLRMIAEFVSERGGGLLVLGGRRALAEGGYAGTPVADVLPFAIGKAGDSSFAALKVEPTTTGAAHPALQVASTIDSSGARWKSLPALTSVNRVGAAKPGATVLLRGSGTSGGERQPVLLFQRFGRGTVVGFPVQDSWLWQMHADVTLEDQTHETFWRQLLRWLVSEVPEQVTVTLAADAVEPGESVTLRAEARDGLFLPVNGAKVTAVVTSPTGEITEVPMEWTIDRDGEYRAAFTTREPGAYDVQVRATMGDKGAERTIASAPASLHAGPLGAEYFDAEMRRTLLQRVAEETGGRFYTAATASSLPEDVLYTESGTTVRRQKELWDMPINLLLLLGLVSAEWGFRRVRGLA